MNLTSDLMLKAISELDKQLTSRISLIMGGGGALILAHKITLATTDIDAIPRGASLESIDPAIKKVAEILNIPGDWLNPYFKTFAHVLPADYEKRLVNVFQGKNLSVDALGKEEMLIMKCYAGRAKDRGHAVSLLRCGTDVKFVESHINVLLEKRIPKSQEALDFLDEVLEIANPR